MARTDGPHSAISGDSPRDRFTAELFDRLWDTYRRRVPHVATYERVIGEHGATFVNDHIAFRTCARQRPQAGIVSLARLFEALGYRAAGCYEFPDKQLTAIHYQHPETKFPKLFVSELRTWELSAAAREAIGRTLASHRQPLPDDVLARLAALEADTSGRDELLETCVRHVEDRPWNPPEKADVEALAAESQYAAWVAVHGYAVNHFTSLINSHGVEELSDIEATVRALQEAGVPMKAEIEGAAGSKLRQTATEAAVLDVDVREDGQPATMPWTYAYFELAERGTVADPESGRQTRFEGFLGPQATHLFEMTRVRS